MLTRLSDVHLEESGLLNVKQTLASRHHTGGQDSASAVVVVKVMPPSDSTVAVRLYRPTHLFRVGARVMAAPVRMHDYRLRTSFPTRRCTPGEPTGLNIPEEDACRLQPH